MPPEKMELWKIWVCLFGMFFLLVESVRLHLWLRFRLFPRFCDGFDRWLARLLKVNTEK